jgi:hypothetical protein
MSETVVGGGPRAWVAEPKVEDALRHPPFDLKDNDGPSMLWVNAHVLEERHSLPGTADRLRELAVKWANERKASGPNHMREQ